MKNQVLDSTRFLVESPKSVFIDEDRVGYFAKKWSGEDFKIPSWDMPVYLEDDSLVVSSFMIGNAINFAFTDFDSKRKFVTNLDGVDWRGSVGMWASIKRAYGEGVPILDAGYLSRLSVDDAKNIFRGNFEIPMLRERVDILREVGSVLLEKYDGSFDNLVKRSRGRCFDGGNGMVDRLIKDFSSYDDSVVVDGDVVRFDKRAQLAVGTVYGRLQGSGLFEIEDIDDLTVFADYVLPQGLRDMGVLKYEKSLGDKIDSQIMIPSGSREELEIRASTIHACDKLINKVNSLRDDSINALHLDYKLWSESRKYEGSKHHLTRTIAY